MYLIYSNYSESNGTKSFGTILIDTNEKTILAKFSGISNADCPEVDGIKTALTKIPSPTYIAITTFSVSTFNNRKQISGLFAPYDLQWQLAKRDLRDEYFFESLELAMAALR
jgi:hypothetical protein